MGFRVKLLTRTTTGWFPSGLSRSPRRGALQELLRKAELNGDVDCLREGVRVLALRSWKSRWRSTSVLNATSYALCKIQERMLRIKDSMEIEDAAGQRVAMVKKALITPVRERWVVNVADGPDLEVQGNILDHEYTIGDGRDKSVEVSKKWFRVADPYGVQIGQGQNGALVLAVTVAIDEMAHPGR